MAAPFGFTHGLRIVDAFYENVSKAKMEGRKLADGEKGENVVLEFKPSSGSRMLVVSRVDQYDLILRKRRAQLGATAGA